MTTDDRLPKYALYEKYPAIESILPRETIGEFPTPIQAAPGLASHIGVGQLYIKRDDLSHPLYGGNKIRKLEYLIADAKKRGAKKLLTFGGIGSNHALATTIHGREHGLPTISMLVPQPVTPSVKRNLLTGHHFGAELCLVPRETDLPAETVKKVVQRTISDGKPPYVIQFGGSTGFSTIGYINAAFELAAQVEAGLLPEPDYVFVAIGTCGTGSGLAVGLRAAGLKTKVIGVKVTAWISSNKVVNSSLANSAMLRLHRADSSFPLIVTTPLDIEMETDYFGERYGAFTPEGMKAIELMKEHAGVNIEGVYTGKAFAGLMGCVHKRNLSDKVVVFWNTYNSSDITPYAEQHDYTELPEEFHQFFNMPEHSL